MGNNNPKPVKVRTKRNYNVVPNGPVSIAPDIPDTQAINDRRSIIYDPYHPYDEYVDVVGSDAGNLTVFSWITQISTCCSSVCTLIILIGFIIWMFLNRNINSIP